MDCTCQSIVEALADSLETSDGGNDHQEDDQLARRLLVLPAVKVDKVEERKEERVLEVGEVEDEVLRFAHLREQKRYREGYVEAQQGTAQDAWLVDGVLDVAHQRDDQKEQEVRRSHAGNPRFPGKMELVDDKEDLEEQQPFEEHDQPPFGSVVPSRYRRAQSSSDKISHRISP